LAVILVSLSCLIVAHRSVPSEITVLTVAWIRRHDRIVGADEVSNRDKGSNRVVLRDPEAPEAFFEEREERL
jgi:hypothetical protein